MTKFLKSPYHFALAALGAFWYGFPSRQLSVIAVTGTKGKTTTIEIFNAILEQAGFKTAISSTLRFKIGDQTEANKKKMTMPGRFFLQRFLWRAAGAGCRYTIIEMTSEGARQFRHRFLDLDALIFTNLAPEHIESHGSYEAYRAAKLEIAKQLARSRKSRRLLVVNGDDREATRFLAIAGPQKIIYTADDVANWSIRLPGRFNRYNLAAAVALARGLGIKEEVIRQAIASFQGVRGRMEEVINEPFRVVVDYAHTPDSLRAAYAALRESAGDKTQSPKLICVLGACGGGRDRWKRPVMGGIAAEHCDKVFLTDEDPYDENPQQIVAEIAGGLKNKNYEIILDRRAAIARALSLARSGDNVIITGKGTDPFIMGPHGSKIPWDDATVVREEFQKTKI